MVRVVMLQSGADITVQLGTMQFNLLPEKSDCRAVAGCDPLLMIKSSALVARRCCRSRRSTSCCLPSAVLLHKPKLP